MLSNSSTSFQDQIQYQVSKPDTNSSFKISANSNVWNFSKDYLKDVIDQTDVINTYLTRPVKSNKDAIKIDI